MLILTHIGSDLPPYIKYNFFQLRLWSPHADIRILMKNDYIELNKPLLEKYNITPIAYEELEDDEQLKRFLKLEWYHNFGIPNTTYPSPPNFVFGTSARLFYLNSYLKKYNLQNILHIENDVLLYENIDDIVNTCQGCYKQLTVVPVGPQIITCAVVFIPNPKDLSNACEFMLECLAMGNDKVVPLIGGEMVQEMTLLNIYKDKQLFPIFPSGNYSDKVLEFGGIFDGASYGQFFLGTNNGPGAGWRGNHHFVGQQINLGKIYNVLLLNEVLANGMSGRIPFVHFTDIKQLIPLHNLHIHSKRLKLALSKNYAE